jgi:hypothetical protein
LQRETFTDWRVFPKFQNPVNLFSADARRSWLRVGPLGRRHRTAAIVVTATGIMNRVPRRIRHATAVARVRRLAHTAGMRLSRRNRQRQRDEVPRQHEQKKKSGSQAMHISSSAGVLPAVAKFAQHRTNSRAVAIERYELDGYFRRT